MKTYLATIKIKLKADDIIDARLQIAYKFDGKVSLDDVEFKEIDDGEKK